MSILNLIFLIIFSLILFFTVAYLLLPWIFKIFISPRFNATYVYKSKDFGKKKDLKPLPFQYKVGQVHFDELHDVYSISFGNRRELINGIIKIRHDFNEYSNEIPSKNQSKLLKLIYSNKSDGSDKLGIFKSVKIQYQLENQEKTINISIKQYNDQDFITFELLIPDVLSNPSSE